MIFPFLVSNKKKNRNSAQGDTAKIEQRILIRKQSNFSSKNLSGMDQMRWKCNTQIQMK